MSRFYLALFIIFIGLSAFGDSKELADGSAPNSFDSSTRSSCPYSYTSNSFKRCSSMKAGGGYWKKMTAKESRELVELYSKAKGCTVFKKLGVTLSEMARDPRVPEVENKVRCSTAGIPEAQLCEVDEMTCEFPVLGYITLENVKFIHPDPEKESCEGFYNNEDDQLQYSKEALMNSLVGISSVSIYREKE